MSTGIPSADTGFDFPSGLSSFLILGFVRARAEAGDQRMIALLADLEAEEEAEKKRKLSKEDGDSEAGPLSLMDQLTIVATRRFPEPIRPLDAPISMPEAPDTEQAEEAEQDDSREFAKHLVVEESESPRISLIQEEVDRIQQQVEELIVSSYPAETYRHVTAQDISEAIKSNTSSDGEVNVEGVIQKVLSSLGGRGKAAVKSRGAAIEQARGEAVKAEHSAENRQSQKHSNLKL
jgi:hypothetical protein